jgi:hypothetical protein
MAAGLGFKTFTTGEVLTAADVNGYLMQGILVFANAAARSSAITSPQEGQYSFLKDTNALEYYDGAAWVGAPVGDITAVNAGTGITGGGASGSVTITNDMATTITASGDIVVGTGSGTYDNLPIGTTGQVLTADTTVSPYKVKWASAASGGGMTSIASGSLSSNTVTISTISTAYNNLQLIVRDFYCASDDYLNFRLNSDGGNNYGYVGLGQSAEDTVVTWADGVRDRLFANYNNQDNTDNNNTAIMTIYDYANTSTWKLVTIQSVLRDAANTFYSNSFIVANYRTTAVIDSITMFSQNTTNFSGGTYILYGVK